MPSSRFSPLDIAPAESTVHLRVVRSGMVEAVHSVSVTVVSLEGSTIFESGDGERAFYLRSSAKPFQASVVLDHMSSPDVETTAVMCSSHVGLPVHVALIERLLAVFGLDESALATPPSWPGSERATRMAAASGHTEPRAIWNNCSGKHAGMLAACVTQGWPIAGYTSPDHPLQKAIESRMVDMFGAGTTPVGVDGCGVPVFRGTTASLARSFAALVTNAAYAPVVQAMSRFPMLVSGPGHADADIAVWLGGLAKRGAEGCLGIGLPGRGALAVKAWDGAERAVAVAALHALDEVGWIPRGARKNLESALTRTVFGGGEPVGTVEPVLEMERT